jgi:hypothetical protein
VKHENLELTAKNAWKVKSEKWEVGSAEGRSAGNRAKSEKQLLSRRKYGSSI